jgi:cephalosporin-C deacetylase-like acetyl esterase
MRIITNEEIIKGIPTLSIFQEEAEKLPLIFYMHGYGGDKEQALDYRYLLAKKGFYVVSFDCDGHGLRSVLSDDTQKRTCRSIYPADTGIDNYFHMHEVVVQTAKDVDSLLNHFKDVKEIDSNRIGNGWICCILYCSK